MSENIILNLGGGGASLNFKVVGNPQPENPRENTIWLNTNTPIGAWYFSATQPENLAPGDVWFPVGTSSPAEFNALKKNGLQVYPMSAKQYVGGALVTVEAKIYQGSKWLDWWDGTVYHYGDSYDDFTGGWEQFINTCNSCSIAFKDDHILVSGSGDNGELGTYRTRNTFDFTNVDRVDIIFTCNNTNRGWAYIYTADGTRVASVRTSGANTSVLSMDASTLKGEHFLVLGMGFAETSSLTVKLYSMKLVYG